MSSGCGRLGEVVVSWLSNVDGCNRRITVKQGDGVGRNRKDVGWCDDVAGGRKSGGAGSVQCGSSGRSGGGACSRRSNIVLSIVVAGSHQEVLLSKEK